MSGSIQLVYLGRLTLTMGESTIIPSTPSGTRIIVELVDIAFEGERLKAKRKGPAAADWIHVGPEGTATLDMRFTLQTEDGAIIYVHGGGRSDASKGPGAALSFFAPRFETSAPAYAWLNKIQAIARGSVTSKQVVFDVFEPR